jgi:NAD(P)-dependent dehydrogenase (short-subunit alcohol dehydrogenase family)
MDLSGKKTLITGASSGLGLATTRKFAEFGAHVIMVCRNEDKARIAAKSIKQIFTDAKLSLIICDLSSFSSTNNFINSIRKKYDRLDVLINNAAIMKQKRTLTKDGFETMFQVNFLSSVLLMNRLTPLLAKSSCGQIINITLPSSKLQLDFNNMQSEKRFESLDAFFKTKLALLLYSLYVAGNPAFERIKVTCAVPNTKPFKSDLVREAPFFAKLFKNLISIPVEKVVENMAYLVEHGIKDRTRGEIFEGKTIINPTSYWQNEKIRKQVYELANNYIAQFSS